MDATLTDWIQAFATVVTAGVAIAAVQIARRAPEAAARFADEFRQKSAPLEERERMKTAVFLALLKGRHQLLHQETIAALNVVDFAFHDDPDVRSQYRLFIEETATADAERIIGRYRDLTVAVAKSLGFGDTMTEADMRLGYYPAILGRFDEAAIAEAEEKIARKAAAEAASLMTGNRRGGIFGLRQSEE